MRLNIAQSQDSETLCSLIKKIEDIKIKASLDLIYKTRYFLGKGYCRNRLENLDFLQDMAENGSPEVKETLIKKLQLNVL